MTITRTQDVIGMTCEHCVRAVTEELSELSGVVAVAVQLSDGPISVVTITSTSPLQQGDIAAAIEEAGYQVPTAQPRPGG
jgi:copper chaperone